MTTPAAAGAHGQQWRQWQRQLQDHAATTISSNYAARMREEREDEHDETDEENERAGHTR